MKLAPHPHRALRQAKVLKHWFHPAEQWWVIERDLAAWNRDWHTVRGAGLLAGDDVPEGSTVEALLATVYGRYLGAAKSACADAIARGTVFPSEHDRMLYVGTPGVYVVVTRRAVPEGAPIVTAYRVVPAGPKTVEGFDQAALAKAQRRSVDRQAVRTATRRSSLRARIEE